MKIGRLPPKKNIIHKHGFLGTTMAGEAASFGKGKHCFPLPNPDFPFTEPCCHHSVVVLACSDTNLTERRHNRETRLSTEDSFIFGKLCSLQGEAPTSYKWGEITPTSRVVTPVAPLYKAIYRGYNSTYK